MTNAPTPRDGATKATNHKAERKRHRILVVDDHPMVSRAMGQLIEDEPGLEVCGYAADAKEALRLIGETKPDLCVVDISLKDSNGLELIKDIKARYPEVKMLVSSAHDESLYAERVLRAGATGFINKGEATERLVQGIRDVLAGQVVLSAAMTDRLLHRAARDSEELHVSPVATLSDRELEVFEMIGNGLITREIARRLGLSPKTIETHREHIKFKLNLKNINELVRHAVKWQLEKH